MCAVCEEEASGMYFGAMVCLPCKSFFIRCTKDGEPKFTCLAHSACDITKGNRLRCQSCRYHKCLAVGMCRKEKPECVQPEEGQELCRVCSDIANGVHFGVPTCEGCKKFFRRALKESSTYFCKFDHACVLNPRNRNACRYCRHKKCLQVGMSRTAIRMGRPKKAVDRMRRLRPNFVLATPEYPSYPARDSVIQNTYDYLQRNTTRSYGYPLAPDGLETGLYQQEAQLQPAVDARSAAQGTYQENTQDSMPPMYGLCAQNVDYSTGVSEPDGRQLFTQTYYTNEPTTPDATINTADSSYNCQEMACPQKNNLSGYHQPSAAISSSPSSSCSSISETSDEPLDIAADLQELFHTMDDHSYLPPGAQTPNQASCREYRVISYAHGRQERDSHYGMSGHSNYYLGNVTSTTENEPNFGRPSVSWAEQSDATAYRELYSEQRNQFVWSDCGPISDHGGLSGDTPGANNRPLGEHGTYHTQVKREDEQREMHEAFDQGEWS